MQILEQQIEDITRSLTTLEAPWQDEHAAKVIALIQGIPVKAAYANDDVAALFDQNFDAAFTASLPFPRHLEG
ncbi:MAG: hypothetical protein JNK48_11125 [Bryobacterales bacterium]|nr:hypothetical protein [Bryobacterales bacterium]